MDTLLEAVLLKFCQDNDLPQRCAQELYDEPRLSMTKEQRNWLFHYIALWDLTQRMENSNGQ